MKTIENAAIQFKEVSKNYFGSLKSNETGNNDTEHKGLLLAHSIQVVEVAFSCGWDCFDLD